MTREVNDRDPGIWRVPVEGFGETMDALEARGIVAGIISNSDGRLERRLAQIGILDRFRFVIDSGVIGVSKPDPRIFEAAVERSSVPASQAAYVGDYYAVDVEGARAVGMKPVLFDPVGAYPDADCDVVRAFGEIVDLVDAWRSESTDPTA
jgi:FMN phosphatase YigB (HAD superfamily)